MWGRGLEEVAPDRILTHSPHGLSVASLLPRAAFVRSGTIPRTDFSCADSGSEPPYLPPPQGVLPPCSVWGTGRCAVKRYRKGDPAKWLHASKGKGERLCHRKELVMEAGMGAAYTHLRIPGSSLALGLVQSRTHPLLTRTTLHTFLGSSADPVGPPGNWGGGGGVGQ